MQNLYKYTRYFQPAESYDEHFTQHFIVYVEAMLREMRDDPIEKSEIHSIDFTMPSQNKVRDEYYNILCILAKLTKVKLMWKNILSHDTHQVIRGLTIVGEIKRIKICNHIMSYYFRAYFMYKQDIKSKGAGVARQAGFKDVRNYSSNLLLKQRVMLRKALIDALATDIKYESWLESIVKEKHRLDYKRYIKAEARAQSVYEHAISRTFHHRRMLL
jgi:hypothetical protein